MLHRRADPKNLFRYIESAIYQEKIKMINLENDYQFAYSAHDFSPLRAERGLIHFMRGVAASLLAPIELLQYVQKARRVERTTGLSWIVSAAMFLCVSTILKSTTAPAAVFSACLTIALAVVNGLLQRLRSVEVERSMILEYLERVA
jgi:hypothetical protein